MEHKTLTQKVCRACEGGESLLTAAVERLLPQVPGWTLVSGKLRRQFIFNDFKEAMAFTNAVAALAESEGHHPDISVGWNKVTLELVTHSIGGLSENDFIIAAKVNDMLSRPPFSAGSAA